jgi:hypothetical protein
MHRLRAGTSLTCCVNSDELRRLVGRTRWRRLLLLLLACAWQSRAPALAPALWFRREIWRWGREGRRVAAKTKRAWKNLSGPRDITGLPSYITRIPQVPPKKTEDSSIHRPMATTAAAYGCSAAAALPFPASPFARRAPPSRVSLAYSNPKPRAPAPGYAPY